jgi:hypothetical protein
MTASRDTEHLIRAFLDEGVTELPERVYDAVRSDIDRTHQRVVIGPWRTPDMNTFAKFAMAIAAVLVVALVGYNLLPGGGGRGGTLPTPSPSPSTTLSPSPSPEASLPPEPTPVEGAIPPAGTLEVGRHSFSQNGVDFSLEIASPDWASSGVGFAPDGGHLTKGVRGLGSPNAVWMLFWSIDGVYSDPCAGVAAPPVSPSAADLASAVATLPRTELVSEPTDVTVGGRAAKHVAIRIPDNIPCPPLQFFLWYDDVPCDSAATCGRYVTAIGETNQVWIVEVDGKHVWIEAETYAGAPPEIEQEVQAIIDSIQFE